jgi:putative colanic acid biosynthesis UDP-glucose lipid carrier transferase
MLWRDLYSPPVTFIAMRLSPNRRGRQDTIGKASLIGNGQSILAKRDSGTTTEAPHPKIDAARRIENRTRLTTRFASQAMLRGPNCTIKRIFDFVVAMTALVALLPLLVVVAIAVTVDTPGPVFFLQWRGGRNGRRFRIVKFRTMTCMEDGVEVCQARPGDARVTRVGRALRRYSIDELPQLFNVLRGEMSLVGPRPHALVHDSIYSRSIAGYADRQLVKPGMTGWAQVNGCRGETRDLTAMERRVERDLEYIQNWSLRFDLQVIARTVRELFRPNKVY